MALNTEKDENKALSFRTPGFVASFYARALYGGSIYLSYVVPPIFFLVRTRRYFTERDHSSRLETRTKEFNIYASQRILKSHGDSENDSLDRSVDYTLFGAGPGYVV